MEPPLLVERDHSSITIGWAAGPTVQENRCSFASCLRTFDNSVIPKYELQYALASSDETPSLNWITLSKVLSTTIVKKKNLEPQVAYQFRIRGSEDNIWTAPSQQFFVLGSDVALMNPPDKMSSETNSITIKWEEVQGAQGYKLRYKKNTSLIWSKIDSVISGCTAKKKGLEMGVSYCFAVMPLVEEGSSSTYSYSMGSQPIFTVTFSPGLAAIFPPMVLHKAPTTAVMRPTSEILSGKVCAIYFSASWCGPCRQFTPQLSMHYNQAKTASKSFEVIFCSLDHNEADFDSYYAKMNWPAIPYDSDLREGLAGRYQVNGIPRLLVLSSAGKVLCDNAVGTISPAVIDSWLVMK